MDGRRCFKDTTLIRMVDGTSLFYKDGWTDDVVFKDGRTTLFYKDGWMDVVVL